MRRKKKEMSSSSSSGAAEQQYQIEDIVIETIFVDISELELMEIRSQENDDVAKNAELRNSQKYFARLLPPLVKRLQTGKYKVIDGNRRVKRAREQGKTKIRVMVIDPNFPDEKLGQVALVSNCVKADMNPEDIATNLLGIYASHGYDAKKVILNIDRLRADKNSRIADPKFAELCLSVGMSKMRQRDYLYRHLFLNPQTKEVMRGAETLEKVRFLTNPKIRKKAEMQTAVARIIKDMTVPQSKQFFEDIKAGRIIMREGTLKLKPGVRSGRSTPIKTADDAKRAQLESSFGILGINHAARMIDIFTQQKDADHKQEVVDETRKWRLASMKRMDVQMLNKMWNYLSFLDELIRDTLPMIEHETESREQKDNLFKP